jgi:hypothetical protein
MHHLGSSSHSKSVWYVLWSPPVENSIKIILMFMVVASTIQAGSVLGEW